MGSANVAEEIDEVGWLDCQEEIGNGVVRVFRCVVRINETVKLKW